MSYHEEPDDDYEDDDPAASTEEFDNPDECLESWAREIAEE